MTPLESAWRTLAGERAAAEATLAACAATLHAIGVQTAALIDWGTAVLAERDAARHRLRELRDDELSLRRVARAERRAGSWTN